MNMRKIIAVLSAVLMLCAVVPFSVSAAPGDVVVNKNFDDGSVFSNARAENGYMVFDATTADWANVYLYANNIKSGNLYEITFDAKANKATNVNVKINNNWAHDTFKWTTNVTTEWATYTCIINPDELKPLTSTALLMFTSDTTAANGAVYHIDNVVVKEYAEPVAPGSNLFVNGDFETGNTNGWNKHQQTTVTADAAKDGSYGAYLNGSSSSWGGVLDQNVNVEDGKTYTFSFDFKAVRQGFNYKLSGVQSGTNYAGGYISTASWTHVEKEITINGDTQLKLNFNCGGQTGTDEMYVDNVSLKEVKDPSFDGYITNGDFETGKTAPWDIYGTTAVNADAAKGGEYGMMLSGGGASFGGIANQDYTVEIGKTYVVRFDMKVVNAGVNVQVKNGGANVKSGYINKTEWTTYSYEYTATATNSNLNFCGSGIAGTDVAYLDNVMVYEKVEQSNDGYIVNGTFDTGVLTPWNNLWGSCTTEVIVGGKDSTFALSIISGQWKHVRQENIAVEANTDYKISVWSKNVKNMSLLVKDAADTANIVNKSIANSDDWALTEVTFNTGANTAILVSFMGGDAEAYGTFDTIVMEKLHTCNVVEQERVDATCGEDGYIKYACDCGLGEYTETLYATGDHSYDNAFDADCNACGNTREVIAPIDDVANSVSEDVSGLAFKFDMQIEGIAIEEGYISKIDYTNATYGGYKLIGMGVTASNYKSSITIEATHLLELEGSAASVAYRIINIPEANYGDTITMVPYFIVEIDGVETTVYGDEYTASYSEFN